MPDYEVEVLGAKRRRRRGSGDRPPNRLLGLLRRILARPGLVACVGLILFVWLVGTPHVAGQYTCNGPLRSVGGCESSYDSCTYYGVQGRRVVFPEPGEQCQLFRFIPVRWESGGAGSNRAKDQYPLNESKAGPLYWGVLAGRCGGQNFPSPEPVCNRLLEMIKGKSFTFIECMYGPINRDGTGWRFYDFWNEKVPPDMASFAIPGEDHPFLILGTLAVPSCPETSDKAEALFQAGRLKL